jgi:hypothetical protein
MPPSVISAMQCDLVHVYPNAEYWIDSSDSIIGVATLGIW